MNLIFQSEMAKKVYYCVCCYDR